MAGDTTNRLAGTAYVTVNGVTVMVEGSFKYQTSTVNR
ncbi:phage tail tube protein, partial [Klebsiella pneumoniae]|nr:phage tail tube protein [Klebsiella pneumoniae]